MQVYIDLMGEVWPDDFPIPQIGTSVKYRGYYYKVVDVVYNFIDGTISIQTESRRG